MSTDVCAIGKVDDGTLRMCCSTHRHILCAHHYARTHFVEVLPEWQPEHACNAAPSKPPKVVDLMAALERSLAHLKEPRS